MELYDLADLVRLISTKWPVQGIEAYDPSVTQQNTLQNHLGGALRSLIRLSELNDWGALEKYRLEAIQEPEEAGEKRQALHQEREALPASDSDAEPASAGQAATLIDRVRAVTAERGAQSAFAQRAGSTSR